MRVPACVTLVLLCLASEARQHEVSWDLLAEEFRTLVLKEERSATGTILWVTLNRPQAYNAVSMVSSPSSPSLVAAQNKDLGGPVEVQQS